MSAPSPRLSGPSQEAIHLAAALRDLPPEQLQRVPEAIDAYRVLCAAYPNAKATDDTRTLFVRYFVASPPDAMMRAVRRWIETEEWFPTIAKFIPLLRAYTPSPSALALKDSVRALRARHDDQTIRNTRNPSALGCDLLTLASASSEIEHEHDQRTALPTPDPEHRARILALVSRLLPPSSP